MVDKGKNQLNNLKLYYFLVFILSALLIAPTHIFPQPYFMYARFPHYLEMMQPILNISWPTTFNLYHYTLYSLTLIFSINALAILFHPKLRQIAIISSSIGAVLTFLIAIFFFFIFINVNIPTALVYGSYSTILFLVSFLTLKVLLRSKKGQ